MSSHRKLLQCMIVLCLFSLMGSCQDKKPEPFRVGILSGIIAFEAVGDGFIQKMEELGYHEGENIVYDFQKIQSDMDRLREVADKFVSDQVDLILAFPTGSAVTAKAAVEGTDIPVVFTWASIDNNDLVQNIRNPHGNITGVMFSPKSDFLVKRFEILTAIVPHAERILLFHNDSYPTSISTLKALKTVAPRMGIELVVVTIRSREDLIAALRQGNTAELDDIDAIYPMPEPVTVDPEGFELLRKYADENRIPLGGNAEFSVHSGALYCYAPKFEDAGALAAPLADKILKGDKPGSLPLVTQEAQLRINLSRAEELGLTVPEGLLKQAIEIIR